MPDPQNPGTKRQQERSRQRTPTLLRAVPLAIASAMRHPGVALAIARVNVRDEPHAWTRRSCSSARSTSTSTTRHAEKLREELTLVRMDRHTSEVEELDVEGILAFRFDAVPGDDSRRFSEDDGGDYQTVETGYCLTSRSLVTSSRPSAFAWASRMRSNGSL